MGIRIIGDGFILGRVRLLVRNYYSCTVTMFNI